MSEGLAGYEIILKARGSIGSKLSKSSVRRIILKADELDDIVRMHAALIASDAHTIGRVQGAQQLELRRQATATCNRCGRTVQFKDSQAMHYCGACGHWLEQQRERDRKS